MGSHIGSQANPTTDAYTTVAQAYLCSSWLRRNLSPWGCSAGEKSVSIVSLACE